MGIEERLSKVEALPRIKQVLQDALNIVNQDEFDFDELAIKLSMDQLLSTSMLRMANSAQFGGRREISSLNEAIVRLGEDNVRTLVRSSVLSMAFPVIKTISLKDYWSKNFEISMIASKIGVIAGLDKNEVFTTGTLHNIGELMIHANLPDEAQIMVDRIAKGEDPYRVQEELLNTTVPYLGARLAHAWNFPPQMVEAIFFLPNPEKAKLSPTLAYTIRLASDLHNVWDSLIKEDDKLTFISSHPSAIALKLDKDVIPTIDGVRGKGFELAYKMFA
ncbi:HDOD domain-containing protein [Vibrio sp. F74]|uniref:HDOD domain-containing protein n=1 Tax=Vibrio sp. F74 TaxID=700020 RepID=UPI0035F55AF1